MRVLKYSETEDVTNICLVDYSETAEMAEQKYGGVLPVIIQKKLAVQAGNFVVPTLLGHWFAFLISEN